MATLIEKMKFLLKEKTIKEMIELEFTDGVNSFQLEQNESILVASDVHLGEQGNEKFISYLIQILDDQLKDDTDREIPCDRLILLGDIFDLWLNDNQTVIETNFEILALLKMIAASKKLHLLLGNHDSYLNNLNDLGYEWLTFYNYLRLFTTNETTQTKEWLYFIHGDQLDWIQSPIRSDRMCCGSEANTALGRKINTLRNTIKIKGWKFLGNPLYETSKFAPNEGTDEITSNNEQNSITSSREMLPLTATEQKNIKEKVSCPASKGKKVIQKLDDLLRLMNDKSITNKETLKQFLTPPNLAVRSDPDPDTLASMSRKYKIKGILKGSPRNYFLNHAWNFVGDINCNLFFGHTHIPFIGYRKTAQGGTNIYANAGGWQGGLPFINTFLEINTKAREVNFYTYSSDQCRRENEEKITWNILLDK